MNQQYYNNNLIAKYQNLHTGVPSYQNNQLLNNNPMFVGNQKQQGIPQQSIQQQGIQQQNILQQGIQQQQNILQQGINPHQIQQMQYMQQMQMANMQRLKELQKVKQIEKLNELENTMDKEKIRESVIKPIKIELTKEEKDNFSKQLKSIESQYVVDKKTNVNQDMVKLWKERTNTPYKTIIKNDDYKKDIKANTDLIVHKITLRDKLGVEDEYVSLKGKIETHNDELKVIYSTSKENEHKKKFDYQHVYKYRVKFDPKDHTELKDDKIKLFKQQQKKMEDNKQKYDNIIESLVNEGIFDKNELDALMNDNKSTNNTSTTSPVIDSPTNPPQVAQPQVASPQVAPSQPKPSVNLSTSSSSTRTPVKDNKREVYLQRQNKK